MRDTCDEGPDDRAGRRFFLAGLGAFVCFPALAARDARAATGPSEPVAGGIEVGNNQGDITIVEFFDYNCPYCRSSAKALDDFLAADRNIRLVLVNYPVLSVASIEAGRVALAFADLRPRQYADFHRRLFARRGRIDGEAALAVAAQLGAERAALISAADAEKTSQRLKQAAHWADALGFSATPSYLIQEETFSGHLALADLRRIATAIRKCGRSDCA
jgi:protein-disulfide isomerase